MQSVQHSTVVDSASQSHSQNIDFLFKFQILTQLKSPLEMITPPQLFVRACAGGTFSDGGRPPPPPGIFSDGGPPPVPPTPPPPTPPPPSSPPRPQQSRLKSRGSCMIELHIAPQTETHVHRTRHSNTGNYNDSESEGPVLRQRYCRYAVLGRLVTSV